MGKADERPAGKSVLESTSSPEALEEIARRREYIRPLFEYLASRCYSRPKVFDAARQRAVVAGEYVPWDVRAWYGRAIKMQRGEARIPPWLVTLCCAVIETSVAEVMGEEWVARYGMDGRGGWDESPASEPRRQRGWVRDALHAGAGHGSPGSHGSHGSPGSMEDSDDAA